MLTNNMIEQEIEIVNKLGLHARAAAKLVSTASKYSSNVVMSYGGQEADCKSIMSVMMLAAAKGSLVKLTIQGEDQEQASNAVIELINGYFGEEE